MSSLDHFPDLCLLSIFRQLSTIELVRTVRVVCAQWNRLAPTKLNRRGTLLVAGSHFELEPFRAHVESSPYASSLIRYIDDLRLLYCPIDNRDIVIGSEFVPRLGRLTPPMVTCLADHLPNITQLTIIHTNIDAQLLEQLSRLIEKWRNQLIRLNLSIECTETYQTLYGELEKLFLSIDQCVALKHLTLHMRMSFMDPMGFSFHPRWSSRFYSQLKSFNFATCSRKSINGMLLHLAQQGTTNHQCEIGIYSIIRHNDLIQLEGGHSWQKYEFARKLVSIQIIDHLQKMTYQDLHLITSRCVSLKSLTLWPNSIPLNMLGRALSNLPNLIHLTLYLKECQIPSEEKLENCARANSVQLLSLHISTKSHLDTRKLFLDEIFPNLQVLTLWHSSETCRDCGYDSVAEQKVEGADELISECMRLARAPFRQCTKLHTIEVNDGPDDSSTSRKLISIDQL